MNQRTRLNLNQASAWTMTLACMALLALAACNINVKKDSEGREKNVDIETPMGALHVTNDADVRDVGLPVYPGARKKEKGDDENNHNNAHVNISSSLFGVKVVAIEYLSDDPPAKLIDFYRDELKKYGSVLECHTTKNDTNATMNSGDSDDTKLKCENDQNGKTTELKAGTQQNQHIVSIKPGDGGKGSDFGLVYVRLHKGKETI